MSDTDGKQRTLTAQGEDRRAEIVDAATSLFSEHGYAATRMTDIADRAGVTKGLLYWYFENKEALIVEILTETREHLRRAQISAVADIADPLAQLYVGTAASVRFIMERYRLYVLRGEPSERSLFTVLGESGQVHAIDTSRAIARGQETGIIRTGVSPMVMAYANAGVVNNLCTASFYGGIDEPIESVMREAASYVLHACAARTEDADAVEAQYLDRILTP